jgi:hypothetical protein
MGSPRDTGSLKISDRGVAPGRREPAEAGNLSAFINRESQPPMTSVDVARTEVGCAVSEARVVEVSEGLDNVFV